MVAYDAKNNLLLVGYVKSDDQDTGGLLRILLSDPTHLFVDNIDLDGVPYEIFIK